MTGAKQEQTNEGHVHESLGATVPEVLASLQSMIDAGRGDERIELKARVEGEERVMKEVFAFPDRDEPGDEWGRGTVRELYAKYRDLKPEEDLNNPNTMKESAEKLLADATPEQIASDAPLDWKWRASEGNAIKQFRELIDKGLGDKVFQHTADGVTQNATANEIYRGLVERVRASGVGEAAAGEIYDEVVKGAQANGMTPQEYARTIAGAEMAKTEPAPYDRHLDDMVKSVYTGKPDDARRALKKADLIRERGELYTKLDGVNEELAAIRPEAKATVAKILERNRQAIGRMEGAEFTPETEAELNAIATRASKLREAMMNTQRLGSPGVYADEIKELDRQVDQILSMQHETPPIESSGAGKVRVLDEKRVARDRHSQIRQLPLAKQLGQKIGELNGLTHEEAHNMNVDAAHLIHSMTGKPVIKAVEEIMDEAFPDLMKAFYPRVYEHTGRYASPRACAAMMANVIAESLRYGYHRSATAYKLLMPGLAYLRERRMPMFFIAPDLLEAVQRTDFDDDINWVDLELPYETGVFILPKGALVHPEDGEISMLIWSRVAKGHHPAPWLGLPSSELPHDAFIILGAALDRMVWYDSILTANVRPTTRLNNLFYRAPGDPQPSVTKSNFMDADLNEKDAEFLEKIGVIVFGTIMAMNARPQLVERGQLIKRVGKGDKVREFWSPNVVGAKYKFKREVPKIVGGKFVNRTVEHGTHASPRMHWRRGHYRNQPFGPKLRERKQIWIEPCLIGAE